MTSSVVGSLGKKRSDLVTVVSLSVFVSRVSSCLFVLLCLVKDRAQHAAAYDKNLAELARALDDEAKERTHGAELLARSLEDCRVFNAKFDATPKNLLPSILWKEL